MKISIKANKLELTPAIAEYATVKIGSLERFIKRFEEGGEAEVTVEIARTTKHHQHGDVYYAEANMNLKGVVIRAEQTDEDMRAAIDKIKDTLKLEIQKHKEKDEIKRQVNRKKKSFA